MSRSPFPALLAGMMALASVAAPAAHAQALSPMRLKVSSSTGQVIIKVRPKNPYEHRIRMTVRVYDHNFRLIRARVVPRRMFLGAGGSRPVTVTIPFENQTTRKIRICAESTPYRNQPTIIRTRVCGKFLAERTN